jgi:uncharacterized protein YoxC
MDTGFARASEYSPVSPQPDAGIIQWQNAIVERLDALQESSTSPDVERRLKEVERKVAGIATLKPEERQGLHETINDLLVETRSLRADSDKWIREIKDVKQEVSEATEAIIEIREHFPALIGSINKRVSKLEHPEKQSGHAAQDRAKKIDKYMEGRPDHKASYEALKGFLTINDVLLNFSIAALKTEFPDKYVVARDKADHRKKWLREVPKI